MVCWIFPVLYHPNPAACHDAMTVAVIGVDEDGSHRHVVTDRWDIVQAFGADEIEWLQLYIQEQVESLTTFDRLKRAMQCSYPTAVTVGMPGVSIDSLTIAFERMAPLYLRFMPAATSASTS